MKSVEAPGARGRRKRPTGRRAHRAEGPAIPFRPSQVRPTSRTTLLLRSSVGLGLASAALTTGLRGTTPPPLEPPPVAALPDAGPVTDPPEQHVAQPVSRGKTRTSVDDAEPPERVRPAAQPVTDATVARPDPQTASDVDHAQTQNFPVDHAQTHDAFAHDHGGDAAFVHDQRGEWLRGDREEVEEVEEVGAAVARLVAWRPELRIADPQHWSRGGRHVAPPATPSQRTGWRAGQVLLPGAPANDT